MLTAEAAHFLYLRRAIHIRTTDWAVVIAERVFSYLERSETITQNQAEQNRTEQNMMKRNEKWGETLQKGNEAKHLETTKKTRNETKAKRAEMKQENSKRKDTKHV